MWWVGLQWLLPNYKTNCDVLEIPTGKYFTIQRYFSFSFAVTFVNLEDYSDFIIETLIIRNELPKKRVRAPVGKKGTSHTNIKVPWPVLCRPGVIGSECYCWKGLQRIFGLYSSKLRPTEVENFLTPHSCPSRQYVGGMKNIQAI